MENTCHKRFWATLLLISALTIIIPATAAQAQTLSLISPAIANENGTLTARFGVSVVEKPILKGELEDGAELVLKCYVSLEEVSDYWINNTVASAEFVSVITFEALTKDFVMTIPGQPTPIKNSDLEALLKQGWGTIETKLGPWAALERGQQYSLSVNTTMHEAGTPEGISRFIYFWSWDTGADTTFILNFKY